MTKKQMILTIYSIAAEYGCTCDFPDFPEDDIIPCPICDLINELGLAPSPDHARYVSHLAIALKKAI